MRDAKTIIRGENKAEGKHANITAIIANNVLVVHNSTAEKNAASPAHAPPRQMAQEIQVEQNTTTYHAS